MTTTRTETTTRTDLWSIDVPIASRVTGHNRKVLARRVAYQTPFGRRQLAVKLTKRLLRNLERRGWSNFRHPGPPGPSSQVQIISGGIPPEVRVLVGFSALRMEMTMRVDVLADIQTPDDGKPDPVVDPKLREYQRAGEMLDAQPLPIGLGVMVMEHDASEPVHHWFSLSYAQYLTIPRSVLQSMPVEWQRRFVACLDELDDTIDWRPKEGCYWVTLKNGRGRYVHDEFGDYHRGRRRIPLKGVNADE